MKVLIAVGGGGHFSPALAVIESMPKDWEVQLVGRKYAFEGDTALSLEYQTAHRLGLKFEAITTGRLQRKFTQHTLTSLVKVPIGMAQANKIVGNFKPDVILSFGGYVTIPVILAAAARRVPIIIHEQILRVGLSNKIASRFATTVCVSWPESKKFFPAGKTILTGNPLRKEFLNLKINREKEDNDLPQLYVTGGSAGAHGINVLIEGELTELLEKYSIVHQTGDSQQFNDFDRLEKKRESLPAHLHKRYKLFKFIKPDEVMDYVSAADLVISRSGINTLTELLYIGKPCLLIPLPYGQHNEQLVNASFVKEVGLGEYVNQLRTTSGELVQKIDEMIQRLDTYKKHKDDARALIHADATQKIIAEVVRASQKKYEKETRAAA
ncbi:MAG TPA: UDP-N-acetylglucosamine--N-acetylmuramyl-(pentapeptide) pyrophosphoryl-undecaprenol N-acetylglucosamine transferase [Candidatus Saccharimonadales bacterium]|nr:UDP-N-acetylglucosamine--N-acetylmuramyl-(pentapeptide) pyrophosphoryl-undecaprenol N-acetylglucosamine transferase [Candidatus Saccharimonadales bacterium]